MTQRKIWNILGIHGGSFFYFLGQRLLATSRDNGGGGGGGGGGGEYSLNFQDMDTWSNCLYCFMPDCAFGVILVDTGLLILWIGRHRFQCGQIVCILLMFKGHGL